MFCLYWRKRISFFKEIYIYIYICIICIHIYLNPTIIDTCIDIIFLDDNMYILSVLKNLSCKVIYVSYSNFSLFSFISIMHFQQQGYSIFSTFYLYVVDVFFLGLPYKIDSEFFSEQMLSKTISLSIEINKLYENIYFRVRPISSGQSWVNDCPAGLENQHRRCKNQEKRYCESTIKSATSDSALELMFFLLQYPTIFPTQP